MTIGFDLTELLRRFAEAMTNGDSDLCAALSNESLPHVSPESLTPFLGAEERSIGTAAGDLLVEIGAASAPALTRALEVGSEREKILALTLLGRIGGEEAREAAAGVLAASNDVNLLHAAIEIARDAGLAGPVEELLLRLGDDPWIEMAASSTLRAIAERRISGSTEAASIERHSIR